MIYITRDNVVYGPYSETEAFEHFKAGQLLQSDLASTDGASDWKPLLEILFPANNEPKPSAPEVLSVQTTPQEKKPRRKRIKWIVGVGVLVIIATGVCTSQHFIDFCKTRIAAFKEQRELAKEDREWQKQHALLAPKIAVAKEALAEFDQINSALDVGVNLADYTRLVLNAKINLDRILPRISDEEWRKHLNDAMTTYIVARDFWMRSNQLSNGEPFFHMPEEDLNLFKRYGLTWDEDKYISQKYGLSQIWNHAKGCSAGVELVILGDKIREKEHRQK
ncbi:MAG: GYF domain-containing protein [Verrucomicrobiota bacterium]